MRIGGLTPWGARWETRAEKKEDGRWCRVCVVELSVEPTLFIPLSFLFYLDAKISNLDSFQVIS